MLSVLSQKLYTLASAKLLLFLGIGFLFFEVIFGYFSGQIKASSQGADILDLAFGYSSTEAYTNYLDKYSPEAFSIYKTLECLDLIFPWFYGGLFMIAISLGFRKLFSAENKWRRINLLPFLMILADYGENIGIMSLIYAYPNRLPFMVACASTFGIVKWTLMVILLVCVLIAIWGLLRKSKDETEM